MTSDDKVQKLQDALPGVTSHMAADALAKSQGDMDQAAGQLGSSFSMGSHQRRAPWYWLPMVILLLAVLLPSLVEGSRSRKR